MPSKTVLVPTAHAKPFTEPIESHGAGGTLKGTQVSHKTRPHCRFCCWYLAATSHLVFCIACISQHLCQNQTTSLALTWASQSQAPNQQLQKQLRCHMLFPSRVIAQTNTEYTGRVPITCTLQDCTPHTGSLAGNPTKNAQARSLSLWCTTSNLWHCLPRPKDNKSLFWKRWKWNPKDHWLQHHQYRPGEWQNTPVLPSSKLLWQNFQEAIKPP